MIRVSTVLLALAVLGNGGCGGSGGESPRGEEASPEIGASAEGRSAPVPGGVCDPSFLRTLAPASEVEFLIRYRTPGATPLRRASLVGLSRREVAKICLERQEEIAAGLAPLRPGFLPPSQEIDEFGPFEVVKLHPGLVPSICQLEDVVFVGFYGEPEQEDGGFPTIPQSLPTTRTDRVQQQKLLGGGVTVAVLEHGGLWGINACFNLNEVQDPESPADAHITKVMAMLGSSSGPGAPAICVEGTSSGYAPAVSLLMANAEGSAEDPADGEVISDWEPAAVWAVSQGADVITMSFHPKSEGTYPYLGSRDVFFDYLVASCLVPVFTSAGNMGDPQNGSKPEYSAGKGYNFFAVGDVLNNVAAGRCEASSNLQSSWVNPETPHRDRELPELAMPGSSYTVLDDREFGHTSAATPAAAAVAALLIEQTPDLRYWPEAIRALMLATADYQLADDEMWAPSPTRDGRDGVGLVNAWQAYAAAAVAKPTVASSHGHDYGELDRRSFTPAPGARAGVGKGGPVAPSYLDKTWLIEVAEKGERVRAAITWNSNVFNGRKASELDLRLSLVALDPDGNPVAWSVTLDNNYQLVDFRAGKPGVYRLEAFGFNIPEDLANHYGVAWMVTTDACGDGT